MLALSKHPWYITEVQMKYHCLKESISIIAINRENEIKRIYFIWNSTMLWLCLIIKAINQIKKNTEGKKSIMDTNETTNN